MNEQLLRVLAAVELSAQQSIEQICAQTKLKAHIVQYAMQSLKEQGILGRKKAAIDRSTLGITDYNFQLCVAPTRTLKMPRLIELLGKCPKVTWIAHVGGRYNLSFTISTNSIVELRSQLEDLSSPLREAVLDREFAIRLKLESFPKRYIHKNAKDKPSIKYGESKSQVSLDIEDKKILSVLSGAKWDSFREVAQISGIPASTVLRRIRSMEEMGVIIGYYYLLDPAKLSRESTKILLRFRNMHQIIRNQLSKFVLKHDIITAVVECLGRWDYELVIETRQTKDISQISELLFSEFSDSLLLLETMPLIEIIKTSVFDPVTK